MPGLDRIDTVPVRAFPARQQEIDRGGDRASVGIDARIAKGLAIMPTLRVRLQLKPRNDVSGGRRPDHQDLFLRSRNSPNTSAALLSFIRTLAATDGSSARNRVTSAARAFSAALSGSTVSANLTLAAVYSWPQ